MWVPLVHDDRLASDDQKSKMAKFVANRIDSYVVNPSEVLKQSSVINRAAFWSLSLRRRTAHRRRFHCRRARRDSLISLPRNRERQSRGGERERGSVSDRYFSIIFNINSLNCFSLLCFSQISKRTLTQRPITNKTSWKKKATV